MKPLRFVSLTLALPWLISPGIGQDDLIPLRGDYFVSADWGGDALVKEVRTLWEASRRDSTKFIARHGGDIVMASVGAKSVQLTWVDGERVRLLELVIDPEIVGRLGALLESLIESARFNLKRDEQNQVFIGSSIHAIVFLERNGRINAAETDFLAGYNATGRVHTLTQIGSLFLYIRAGLEFSDLTALMKAHLNQPDEE